MGMRVLGVGDRDKGIPTINILVNIVEAEPEPLPFQAALAMAVTRLP